MKNLFPGHFPLSEDELSELMQKAIFVLDTNVLLNMYRYTEPSREHFFEIIERLGNRVSIPYQVASEFFDARTKVIQDQNKAIDLMDKAIEDSHNKLKNELNQFRKHAHVDIAKILGEIGQSFNEAQAEIRRIKESRSPVKVNDDPILHRLAHLLANCILPEPSQEDIEKRKKLAAERIKKNVPPGFADKNKPGDRSHGDVLIWLEIIALSQEKKLPIVFVTDDVKDDWWLRLDGQIIGPLPALRQEFHKCTQQSFHMYQAENFIKHAAELLKIPVDEEALSEAAKVSADQARAWSDTEIALFLEQLTLDDMGNVAEARRSMWDKASPQIDWKNVAGLDSYLKRQKDVDGWRALFSANPRLPLKRVPTESSEPNSRQAVLQQYFLMEDKFVPAGEPKWMVISKEDEDSLLKAQGGIVFIEQLGGFFAFVRSP
ncbi:PIN domain-containing protein [Ralstonia sp. CHL-2022]|uniref:PIN domain-containing protein n=1 Tax=Ralstonia mojiangensis TaxID=2953895 RepID=A0AAE3LB42_9RALS|nr:PIN domain-containing protein [Ralstonia mojiangensis]MCT7316729.1 PIN domain-containing protein [Ralstonia mojiangensis]